jgi:hypothetical protein
LIEKKETKVFAPYRNNIEMFDQERSSIRILNERRRESDQQIMAHT